MIRPASLVRLLPWIAVAAASYPLIHEGFPLGHDWIYELVRVAEYGRAAEAGQTPPHWAENLYGGYGSPVFIYYAPLFVAAGSLLARALGSVPGGAALLLVLLTAISAVAVYRVTRAASEWAREDGEPLHRSHAGARIAVYLFLLNPYMLTDKLHRNANAEFTALALAPVAFCGLFLLRRRPRRAVLLLSLGTSLVVLSHNLTALTLLVLLAAWALLIWSRPFSLGRWVRLGAGEAIGLGLSFFFWFPALRLLPLVRSDELVTGKFDFHGHFPSAVDLFGYERFFSVGLFPLLVIAMIVLALFRRSGGKRERIVVAGSLATALILLFLAGRLSLLLWERSSLLPLFQFPWRFLGPLALFLALGGGLAFVRLLEGRSGRVRGVAEVALFILALWNALPSLVYAQGLPPDVSGRMESLLSARSVRVENLSVTVGDEYLPREAHETAWRSRPASAGPVIAPPAGAKVRVLSERGSAIELALEAEDGALFEVARWAYPGWTVTADGRKVSTRTGPSGTLAFALPAGDSRVRITKQPPPERRAGVLVSLAALLVWVLLAFPWRRANEPRVSR